MSSTVVNPGGQIPVQREQEKHFGPPVLGKKLFKAKAKGLNADRFMTLPKGATYFREKADTLVKTVLNAPKEFWRYGGITIYDTLNDEGKERIDGNLERAKKNGVSIETLGDSSGHKIIIRAGEDKIIVLYADDIQYQAILSAKEANYPSANLINEIVVLRGPAW